MNSFPLVLLPLSDKSVKKVLLILKFVYWSVCNLVLLASKACPVLAKIFPSLKKDKLLDADKVNILDELIFKSKNLFSILIFALLA